MSGRAMREELREAKTNRSAAVGLVVFTPAHAPAGIAPFDVRAGDVYCVIDPAAPDAATLEAAVRLARLLAIATLRESEAEIDASRHRPPRWRASASSSRRSRRSSRSSRRSRRQQPVCPTGLDRLRDNVIARVAEAEAEIRRRCVVTRNVTIGPDEVDSVG